MSQLKSLQKNKRDGPPETEKRDGPPETETNPPAKPSRERSTPALRKQKNELVTSHTHVQLCHAAMVARHLWQVMHELNNKCFKIRSRCAGAS